MQPAFFKFFYAGLLAVLVVGCGPGAGRYPIGTKFYERSSQRYYGKVVAYESRHDFAGGLHVPAVKIEFEGGKPSIWAACDVIDYEHEAKAPGR